MSLADKSPRLEEARHDDDPSAAEFAKARYQNELARIDREWEIEKEKHLIWGRWGWYIPSVERGIFNAVFGGLFGIVIAIVGGPPDVEFFSSAKIFFVLLGAFVAITTIWYGVYAVRTAGSLNKAFEAYQRRRAAVNRADFR